jgi:hypothetical protein
LVALALERSTFIDAFRVFDRQNPTNIDEDMIFYAFIIQTQLHHGIFVVVRIAVTKQPLVQIPPTNWRSKIQIMEMQSEPLNV